MIAVEENSRDWITADGAVLAVMESFVGLFVRCLPKLQRQKENTKQALVQPLCCAGGVD